MSDEREWVEAALAELERGEHATKGRDFGRGVAHAARVVRAALAAAADAPQPERNER